MTSSNNVQNTHMSDRLRRLHMALMQIISVMNQPQRDEAMLDAAGVKLDRALFPLLVGIERLGPIGVVDLADRAGRDYTTVSRQVARLEALGLVERRNGSTDKRVREAVVTEAGRAMTGKIDAARERLGNAAFENWDEADLDDLVRLIERLADAMRDGPNAPRPK